MGAVPFLHLLLPRQLPTGSFQGQQLRDCKQVLFFQERASQCRLSREQPPRSSAAWA